jgi:hypothetical protein
LILILSNFSVFLILSILDGSCPFQF